MRKEPALMRFWRYVDKNGPIPAQHPDLGRCWLWTGAVTHDGYGHFWTGRTRIVAHKFTAGDAPHGLTWDHLCRTRNCVRKTHLEAVTCRINILRGNTLASYNAKKTHCCNGHPYDSKNTKFSPDGRRRYCSICRRISSQERRARIVADPEKHEYVKQQMRNYYRRNKSAA